MSDKQPSEPVAYVPIEPERKTEFDPRQDLCVPMFHVDADVFMAAKDAVYGAMSYLDMEFTAHRPIQGDASPKVIAYWAAAAVLKVLAAKQSASPAHSEQQP